MGRRKTPLHEDYFKRSQYRRVALGTLFQLGAYADVVRESQELVELLLKALLRKHRIDPPKWHDVGAILEENEELFPDPVRLELARIRQISRDLRKDREMSFYGDEDLLPSEAYSVDHAKKAMDDCDWLLSLLAPLLAPLLEPDTSLP